MRIPIDPMRSESQRADLFLLFEQKELCRGEMHETARRATAIARLKKQERIVDDESIANEVETIIDEQFGRWLKKRQLLSQIPAPVPFNGAVAFDIPPDHPEERPIVTDNKRVVDDGDNVTESDL